MSAVEAGGGATHTPGVPAPCLCSPIRGREAPSGLTGLLGACPVLTSRRQRGAWAGQGVRAQRLQPVPCVSVKTQSYTASPCDPEPHPTTVPPQRRTEALRGRAQQATVAQGREQLRVHGHTETHAWPCTRSPLGTERKATLTPAPGRPEYTQAQGPVGGRSVPGGQTLSGSFPVAGQGLAGLCSQAGSGWPGGRAGTAAAQPPGLG